MSRNCEVPGWEISVTRAGKPAVSYSLMFQDQNQCHRRQKRVRKLGAGTTGTTD